MKRIAMFLDGTWNRPDDNTNVYRAWQLISDADGTGNPQRRYYHPGVGTGRQDRFWGALTGAGLDENLRAAYQWLVAEYEQADKIYLFGFSRGAYTARSLAGLIVKCGLLWPGSMFSVPQVFDRYRRGKDVPPLYELTSGRYRGKRTAEDELLVEQSRLVDIEFIGVWDTVRALGLPGEIGQRLTGRSYYFHSTNPSVRYRKMYQALAIDENRSAYRETLWTQFQPLGEPPPALKPYQTVEQRWFVGSHCNVGGGYRNDGLAQLPLAWLLEKAQSTGLKFKRPPPPLLSGQEYLTDPVDSYARFLSGAYRLATLDRRFFRPIGADPQATKSMQGWSHAVNEWIDASVFDHWRAKPKYRPKNLSQWAKRRGVDLNTIIGDQSASP